MTTVADIRAGKTCPGCDSDCRNFVSEADCCIYQTFISSIFTEVVEDESEKEVQYEPVKERRVIVKIMPDKEVTIKAISRLARER